MGFFSTNKDKKIKKKENKNVKDTNSMRTETKVTKRTPFSEKMNKQSKEEELSTTTNTDTNQTQETNNVSLDLKTEYEDAVQQRLTGKVVQCCDIYCTGRCDNYNQVDGKIDIKKNYNLENIPTSLNYTVNSESSESTRKGYVCIERMLDHFQVNKYILCGTIGKGSFSKVKLGCVLGSDQFCEKSQIKQFIKNYSFKSESSKNNDSLNKNGTFEKSIFNSEISTRNNNDRVAIKIIPRNLRYNSINKETKAKRETRIFKEAFITSVLSNNHIIRLRDFFYNSLHFFMVYEFVEGQSLLDLIKSRKYMGEKEARKVFKQLVCGIKYLHENAIVHRDLKIENILVTRNGFIKIIDFGLSNFFSTDNSLSTFCGSLQFAAPELLRGIPYEGPEIDIWSLGIILFVMLNGKLPFDDREIPTLHSKIKKGSFRHSKTISTQAKTLIRGMIEGDARKRFTLSQVENSDWLKNDENVECECCQESQKRENQNSTFSDRLQSTDKDDTFLTLFNTIAEPDTPRSSIYVRNSINPYSTMSHILAEEYDTIPKEILENSREEMTHRFVKDLWEKRKYEFNKEETKKYTEDKASSSATISSCVTGGKDSCSFEESCHFNCGFTETRIPGGEQTTNTIRCCQDGVQYSNLKESYSKYYDNQELSLVHSIPCTAQTDTIKLNKQLSHFFNLYKVEVEQLSSPRRCKNCKNTNTSNVESNNDRYNCYLSINQNNLLFTLNFYYNIVNKNHYVCVRKCYGDDEMFRKVIGWLKEVLLE